MSSTALRLVPGTPPDPPERSAALTLGERLVARGVLAPGDLARTEARLARQDARLTDVLLALRLVSEADITATMALHWQARQVDLAAEPPDVRLIDTLGAARCLALGLVPWRRAGADVVVVTARPDEFERRRAELAAAFGPVRLAVASERAVQAAVTRARQRSLAHAADRRVPDHESCRGSFGLRLALWVTALAAMVGLAAVAAPVATLWTLTGWALFCLALSTGLKAAAAIASLRPLPARDPSLTSIAPRRTVSLLVPLFRERAIAGHLVERLSRLTYPRELLDICLVVEEDDSITQDTIAETRLPPWMRQIVVPRGALQTKPRALNYALDFCRGTIVGVYDAEDEPDPDQIQVVVDRFGEVGEDVACLQGVLDFYNPRETWIARCFAIEYATWFRVVLPGLARLGLVVPLGGTTLFFRRPALERLGAWDAHNVTEDADLGVRLARHGYRTELLATRTLEEANCRPLAWIKQRSRWLKGYAVTYAVHMRAPRQLWRDLGPLRFLGVQIVFLGTLSQFVLAPALWSFWLFALGLPHFAAAAPPWIAWLLMAVFLSSEAVALATGGLAVWRPGKRWLAPWMLALQAYFPLGALAVYKALWELVSAPYYWDKTRHGQSIPRHGAEAPHRRIPPPPVRR